MSFPSVDTAKPVQGLSRNARQVGLGQEIHKVVRPFCIGLRVKTFYDKAHKFEICGSLADEDLTVMLVLDVGSREQRFQLPQCGDWVAVMTTEAAVHQTPTSSSPSFGLSPDTVVADETPEVNASYPSSSTACDGQMIRVAIEGTYCLYVASDPKRNASPFWRKGTAVIQVARIDSERPLFV